VDTCISYALSLANSAALHCLAAEDGFWTAYPRLFHDAMVASHEGAATGLAEATRRHPDDLACQSW
jgi:hypothetical protein